MADPSSSSSLTPSTQQTSDSALPLPPGKTQHGNSRFAYVYAVFVGGDEGIHPEMGPAIFLLPWLIFGTFGDTFAFIALMRLIGLESNLEVTWFMSYVAVIIVSMFSHLVWCLPHELPRLGSARKIVLEMVALQAAMLARELPNEDRSLGFLLLVSLTTSVYVRIKHDFAVFDIGLGDVFLVVPAQSLIYWAPNWGSILFYVCFAGCRFWSSGEKAAGDDRLPVDRGHVGKATGKFLAATEEVSSEEKDVLQLERKESEQLIITIATPKDDAQFVSTIVATPNLSSTNLK